MIISFLFLNQCGINESSVYKKIRDHADQVKVINAHEHQHWPEEYGKDVVSEVLANRVERGLLTEEVAIDIVDRVFRENVIEVFNLEERLGREF